MMLTGKILKERTMKINIGQTHIKSEESLNHLNSTAMKTSVLLILIFVISSLTGCKFKKEAEQLQMENNNLTGLVAKSDSTLKEFQSLINDIETGFDTILSGGTKPGQTAISKDLRTRLNRSVTEINNLLNEKEKRNQTLRSLYASSNARVTKLEEEIKELNLLVKEKERVIDSSNMRITGMNNTIEGQNSKISDLVIENRDKDETLNARLNTAYYITGAEKDLRNSNIILKTGGFLGFLGRVNILNPQLDKSRLEMIDIRGKKTFTLNGDMKKMEFITQHPSGSYEIKEGDPGLIVITVTDTEKFWGGSKFLVVAI
jgi:septal ring factor EnvC (AmiA/AmiB activator)